MRELPARPKWWPDWVPENCPNCGRPWRPGTITLSRVGSTDDHAWICAELGCSHEVCPPER